MNTVWHKPFSPEFPGKIDFSLKSWNSRNSRDSGDSARRLKQPWPYSCNLNHTNATLTILTQPFPYSCKVVCLSPHLGPSLGSSVGPSLGPSLGNMIGPGLPVAQWCVRGPLCLASSRFVNLLMLQCFGFLVLRNMETKGRVKFFVFVLVINIFALIIFWFFLIFPILSPFFSWFLWKCWSCEIFSWFCPDFFQQSEQIFP